VVSIAHRRSPRRHHDSTGAGPRTTKGVIGPTANVRRP